LEELVDVPNVGWRALIVVLEIVGSVFVAMTRPIRRGLDLRGGDQVDRLMHLRKLPALGPVVGVALVLSLRYGLRLIALSTFRRDQRVGHTSAGTRTV